MLHFVGLIVFLFQLRRGIEGEIKRQLDPQSEAFKKLERDLIPMLPPSTLHEKSIHIESNVIDVNHLRGEKLSDPESQYYRPQFGNINDKRYDIVEINYNGHNFEEEPKVLLSLLCIDSDQCQASSNLRIKIELLETKKEYCKVKINTWSDSYIYWARISWIVYGK